MASASPTRSPTKLCKEFTKYIVPVKDAACPNYWFEMEADFALKKTENPKKNVSKWQEQYCIVGIILSAILNTCGGIFSVLSLNTVDQDVIDQWSNRLPSQLAFIPRWVHKICLSFHYIKPPLTQTVVIDCGKSPRLITYNTHMFIRSPEGSSFLADSDTVLTVLNRSSHAPSASTFHVASAYTYGESLPSENKLLEYKHWSTATVQEVISKLKDNRTTKCLFSLANNEEMGNFIIGVQDEDCSVKGLLVIEAEQLEFKRHLKEWLLKDDEGNDRIWGEEGRVPAEGTDWNVSFVPVTGCPDNLTRVLIVIKMYPCSGGMFERCPECYMLTDAGEVCRLPLQEWKQRITRDVDTTTSIAGSTNLITAHSGAHLLPSATTAGTPTVASVTPSVASATPSVASVTPSVASAAPDESSNSYESAQWTKCADWMSYISEANCDILDTGIAGFQSSMMEMREGVTWNPSRQSLYQRFPSSQYHIGMMLTMIENVCGPVPACAISFASFADSFQHQAPIIRPAGHILDTLLMCQNNLVQMWSCLDTRGNDAQQHEQSTYANELSRVLQKNTLLQPMITYPFNPISFKIEPVLYYSDTNQSITLPQYADTTSQNSTCLHPMTGVSLESVQSAIVSLLIVRNVSIKDRVGRDKTFTLTKQQVDVLHILCNQRISLVEAPPGCGKSVMASCFCQRFRRQGDVLYISPSRGYAAMIDHQGIANVKVTENDADIVDAIKVIYDRRYHAIIVDDIQGIVCREKRWTALLDAVFSRDVTKILLLMDSKHQDFLKHHTCDHVKKSVKSFCEAKHLPESSITLTCNLRNSRKVFTFLKAQILKEPGIGLVHTDLSIGHQEDGDDVEVKYVARLLEDSVTNGVILLIKDLLHNERGYEANDIIILVGGQTEGEHGEEESSALEQAAALRYIFKKNMPDVPVHSASDVPHKGIAIDTVDAFLGMEGAVCLALMPQSSHKRSHHNMHYRLFAASRGTTRVELILFKPFSTEEARAMALSNTSEAKRYTSIVGKQDKRVKGQAAVQDQHLTQNQDTHQDHDALILPGSGFGEGSLSLVQRHLEQMMIMNQNVEKFMHRQSEQMMIVNQNVEKFMHRQSEQMMIVYQNIEKHMMCMVERLQIGLTPDTRDRNNTQPEPEPQGATGGTVERDHWSLPPPSKSHSSDNPAAGSRITQAVSGEFNYPRDVAVCPHTGRVMVTDSGRIQILDDQLSHIKDIRDAGGGKTLSRPRGICINSKGDSIVSDYRANRVLVYDKTGSYTSDIVGPWSEPWGIAVDSDDRLYVCDGDTYSIKVIGKDGKIIRTFGREGTTAGRYDSKPLYVAVHGDQVVVSADGGRVFFFTLEGAFIKELESGIVKMARGLAAGPSGELIIVDDKGPLTVMREGRVVSRVGQCGDEPWMLKLPMGVAVTKTGQAVVANYLNNNLLVYDIGT